MGSLKAKIAVMINGNRRTVVVTVLIVVLAAVAIYLNSDILPSIWPSEYKVQKQLSVLKHKQENLRKAIALEQKQLRDIAAMSKSSREFWLPSRNGDPKIDMRKKIEQAARTCGMKLKSLGTMRTSKVSENILSYEMSVSADAEIEVITSFMAKLAKNSPRFYWKTFSLRPDNIRKPKLVVFSGTLKIVAISSPEIIKMLWGEKK